MRYPGEPGTGADRPRRLAGDVIYGVRGRHVTRASGLIYAGLKKSDTCQTLDSRIRWLLGLQCLSENRGAASTVPLQTDDDGDRQRAHNVVKRRCFFYENSSHKQQLLRHLSTCLS